MSATEAERLQLAQQGDQEAFTSLIESYQTPVFNLCYRMLGDPAEAEDAAQETFWRAFQAIRRYDPKRSFITWLLSIAAHYCIDQQRRRHANILSIDILPDEDAPDPAPDPEKVTSRREEERRVRQMLDSLGPQDRAAIVMRYWHDLSEEEIAEALNLTVSAVKSRLHRARRQLAAAYQQETPKTAVLKRSHYESSAL